MGLSMVYFNQEFLHIQDTFMVYWTMFKVGRMTTMAPISLKPRKYLYIKGGHLILYRLSLIGPASTQLFLRKEDREKVKGRDLNKCLFLWNGFIMKEFLKGFDFDIIQLDWDRVKVSLRWRGSPLKDKSVIEQPEKLIVEAKREYMS